MTKKHHKKQRTKIVYREKPIKEIDLTPKVRKEIEDLQAKKALIPKGFKGFLQKASINKAINDKRRFLKSKEGERNLGAATQTLKKRIDFEKARGELHDLRKKNYVDFEGLGGIQTEKKQLKFEDLF